MSTSKIELSTVAVRSEENRDMFVHLMPVDWVVLDFTDGRRNVRELTRILPLDQETIIQSLARLQSLGLVDFAAQPGSGVSPALDANNMTLLGGAASSIERSRSASRSGNISSGWGKKRAPLSSAERNVDIDVAMADLSDDECLKFIPRRLLPNFRAFTPEIASADLDIDLGRQAIIEFLVRNLDSMTPFEVLGVSESASADQIRQAYLKKSRVFHPDRYFRKNLGQFTGLLANLFKAISQSYNTLNNT